MSEIESKILVPDEATRVLKAKDQILLPISKPKEGVAGKTGSWRIFRPILHPDKCIKCYQCYISCPDVAIIVENFNELPKWNYDFCKGCGICANVCPRKAIEMREES